MNNQKQSQLFDRLHQKYQNISLYETKDREKLDLKKMDIKEIVFLVHYTIWDIHRTSIELDELDSSFSHRNYIFKERENEEITFYTLKFELEERGINLNVHSSDFYEDAFEDDSTSLRFNNALIQVVNGKVDATELQNLKVNPSLEFYGKKYKHASLFEENALENFDLQSMGDSELAYLTHRLAIQIEETTQALDEMEILDKDRDYYLTDYNNEIDSFDTLLEEWDERGIVIQLDGKDFDYSNSIDGAISERFKTCLVEVSSGEEKSETLSQFQQSSLKRGK